VTRYGGVVPVVPTPFTEDDDLDPEGQRRVLDFLLDAGVHGMCLLANWSEQFSLTDAERAQLTELALSHVAGRVPVVVTASHYSTRVAVARSRHAAANGAAMVMLMPPYHGASVRVGEAAILEQVRAVADAIDIPIMIQDAPMAGTPLSVGFLAQLAREVPQARYFKLENESPPDKLRALIAAGGDTIEGPWDGEESLTLLPDLMAGATGTMPGATCPEILVQVWDLWHAHDHEGATERFEQVLPLISHENRITGLATCKVLLKEGGVIGSDRCRHPLAAPSPAARARLLDLGRRLDLLALRWGH
jgi:dihydrodipicolinate synthase/N-acetylneuraminate lyase